MNANRISIRMSRHLVNRLAESEDEVGHALNVATFEVVSSEQISESVLIPDEAA